MVDGKQDEATSPAEVDAVLALLAKEVERTEPGGRSLTIGVASPFRAQAEAITEQIRERWTAEEIERVRLRVGTVHSFQGDERDVMVLSLAVGSDGEGLRFLEDPNLFNVLVTRARRRVPSGT